MQSLVVYVKGKVVSEKYWNEYGQDMTKERKTELEKDKAKTSPEEKKTEKGDKQEKKSKNKKPDSETEK